MKPIPFQDVPTTSSSSSPPIAELPVPTPREEDLTLDNNTPPGVSFASASSDRRWASSRCSALCVIDDAAVPFRLLRLLFPTLRLRAGTVAIRSSSNVPLLPPQKKSSANSESVRISTRFLHDAGTARNARFIPREMAATSLEVRDGTVRRAVASIRSSFPEAHCDVVVLFCRRDAPWRMRNIDAIPSCFEPPCAYHRCFFHRRQILCSTLSKDCGEMNGLKNL
mmetsp:Transcript_13589/g.32894  ORF Transcript_13589/g.32894 Transcript_13589/m.32894 type:complete len:224 (+) Transcript_13589:70-741(+)